MTSFTLRPVGRDRNAMPRLRDAPRFYTEGAPPAFLEIRPAFRRSLRGLRAGDHLIVITWLHRGRRYVQTTYPVDDKSRPRTGVFRTRSPDRPNPIGLHRCTVLEVREDGLRIDAIEAIDGTPIVDIKPVVPEADDS